MGNYSDFISGINVNDYEHKPPRQTYKPLNYTNNMPSESHFANSENFSHLEYTDIPQPSGKVFRRKRT